MNTEMGMQTVDLNDWRFSFGGDPRFVGTSLEKPSKTIEFSTAIDLLKHLARDDTQQVAFQNRVQDRLRNDPIARKWHKKRTKIGDTTHFRSYRRNPNYQTYHDAAAAISTGHATEAHYELVQGLDAEIGASCVIVPAGQMLFHGRGDRDVDGPTPYPSFVSTSLDPTVSIYHAIKRQSQRTGARATIYALTMELPLSAMWGNGGSLDEWELLLQTGLTFTVSQQHVQGRFDIIEASIRP